MTTQERNNTAAGMVRDALERLLALESVQNLRHYENTKDEAAHWLDLAQDALDYFAQHYDFESADAMADADKRAKLEGLVRSARRNFVSFHAHYSEGDRRKQALSWLDSANSALGDMIEDEMKAKDATP